MLLNVWRTGLVSQKFTEQYGVQGQGQAILKMNEIIFLVRRRRNTCQEIATTK